MGLWQFFLFQTFGRSPRRSRPVVDVIWPNYASGKLGHLRIAAMLKREFTGGDESSFHALYAEAIDTDLMFLAGRCARRRRAASSTVSRSTRRCSPARTSSSRCRRGGPRIWPVLHHDRREARGKRVFMIGAYHLMYELANAGLERGVKNVFAKDSAILTGGGLKGFVLPDGYMDVIQEFLGVDRIQEGYGMSEISAFHWACARAAITCSRG